MSPLFKISSDRLTVNQLPASRVELEKHLQKLVEQNLERIFGIKFVASEYEMRGEQQGRIDTLGLDVDGSPTIIEYKRHENESVVNQGLYYMSWLKEHRGDFELITKHKLGYHTEINWSHPRLIVIALTFAKWDTHAVKQMSEGIELWRYVMYGSNLLFLEQVHGQQRIIPTPQIQAGVESSSGAVPPSEEYTINDHLDGVSELIKEIYLTLRSAILELAGEEGEIIETPRKLYIAYRHGKNICEIKVQKKSLIVYVDVPYEELEEKPNIARDVAKVGHWGTGNSEFMVKSEKDIPIVLKAVRQSYVRTL